MRQLISDILKSPKMREGVAWQRKYYETGEIVTEQNELGEHLYYVEQGQLAVSTVLREQNERAVLAVLSAGDIFGESCLHAALPRIARVTAMTEARLLKINGERLSIYLDDHPIQGYLFYKSLFEIMFSRLDRANQETGS